MKIEEHGCNCGASGCCGAHAPGVSRRQFMASAGAAAIGGSVYASLRTASAATAAGAPGPVAQPRRPLRMQPVLVYNVHQRREAVSWRPWCGLITEAHAEEERNRIRAELAAMQASADFPLELLPLVSVQSEEEAANVAAADHDGVIIYGAAGGTGTLIALANPSKLNVMFVRHRSGPAYLWYEIVHPRFLRRETDAFQNTGNMNVHDVVVDDYNELLWRLRALNGLKHARGKRVICIGGALGWDRGQRSAAPDHARELWNMDLVEISYDEMAARIAAARDDTALVERCVNEAGAYLEQPGVTLLPEQAELTTAQLVAGMGSRESLVRMRRYVDNAFVLTEVFTDLMREHETDAITVGHCMGAIIPMAETTACLSLTLLNDSGCLAFCESDFVVIPSGILLHYISNTPVFFCNPTFPHNNMVTVAHCTAPRKMDGVNAERTLIRTHFESDYGAAPKVEMRRGQNMTVLVPNFTGNRWAGFEGRVLENPALDICTSQVDLHINGDSARLVDEMQGFHWMTCYGNYLRETGYALQKMGIGWLNLSDSA